MPRNGPSWTPGAAFAANRGGRQRPRTVPGLMPQYGQVQQQQYAPSAAQPPLLVPPQASVAPQTQLMPLNTAEQRRQAKYAGRTEQANAAHEAFVQSWLWDCWRDATERWLPALVGNDPWALVLNGDLVEGVHHKTKQVISTDTADHVDAALALLEPLAKLASKTFVVKGTECHSGTNETTIGKVLKAEKDPETGKEAWDRLSLTVAGTRCIFQHHVQTAMRPYLEASGLGIALGTEQLEAAKSGEPIPRVLSVAHRHRFGEYRDASGLCVAGPPWQALTRFGYKVVPSARTRPGLFALDWRNRRDGELPELHAQTYRTPEPKGVVV
jgi:hypothetical protein